MWIQELDSIILVAPFQLEIYYDSMIMLSKRSLYESIITKALFLLLFTWRILPLFFVCLGLYYFLRLGVVLVRESVKKESVKEERWRPKTFPGNQSMSQ